MELLHDIITKQSAANPLAPAIYWQDQSISYAELNNNIQLTIKAVLATTSAGDRIGVLALNCPAYIALMYAVPAAGRILVPLNTRLAAEALVQQIKTLDIQLLIGDNQLIASLSLSAAVTPLNFGEEYNHWLALNKNAISKNAPPHYKININAQSTAWLLFTSGTTGLPKAACLSHQSLFAGLESANFGRPVHKGDRYLYPFPLFHISAHNVLHQHQHGAAVALLPSFNAVDVLTICEAKK